MSEKWHQPEICIVINDKSQGTIVKHISCAELLYLYYTFIIQSASEKFFLNGEHLAKLQAKWLTVPYTHSPCTFVLKDAELAIKVE